MGRKPGQGVRRVIRQKDAGRRCTEHFTEKHLECLPDGLLEYDRVVGVTVFDTLHVLG